MKYLFVISLLTTSIFIAPLKYHCDDYYLCYTCCCTLMMSMTQDTLILSPFLYFHVFPCRVVILFT